MSHYYQPLCRFAIAILAFVVIGVSPDGRASAQPNWDRCFGSATGIGGTVNCLGVYQGSLYAGGAFTEAGGVPVSFLARWDGTNWHDVLGGVSGSGAVVNDVIQYNDGFGDDLWVVGKFDTAGSGMGAVQTINVARLSPSGWVDVDNGLPTATQILTLAIGPAPDYSLYLGDAGGTVVNPGVYRWNPLTQSWGLVGTTMASSWYGVVGLDTGNDGTGSRLLAGGVLRRDFPLLTYWGGAKWNGQEWLTLDGGPGRPGPVFSVVRYFNWNGILYAGGNRAQLLPGIDWYGPIEYYVGTFPPSWNRLPNYDYQSSSGEVVHALDAYAPCAGTELLIVAGLGLKPLNTPQTQIAGFSGGGWSEIGPYDPTRNGPAVYDLQVHEGYLYVGGWFVGPQCNPVRNVARYACRPLVCLGDYNCDGVVNVIDIVAFQTDFASGQGRADFNCDGAWNINDFVAFNTALAQGCQ